MKVYTTGQIAKLCKVAPRTVSKWFDSGKLKGYRIPGSQDRRVPHKYLVQFLKEHGMPLEGLEEPKILAFVSDAVVPEALIIKSLFDLGAASARTTPEALYVQMTLAGAEAAISHIQEHHPKCEIIRV